ncbi:MAG: hypothetical protein ACOYNS_16785, partial [Bacteroidota bacterium]
NSLSELFYIKKGGMLMRAAVSFSKDGIENVSKKELFSVPLTTNNFDVSRDGRSIAFVRAFEAQDMRYPPISMKVFWNIAK